MKSFERPRPGIGRAIFFNSNSLTRNQSTSSSPSYRPAFAHSLLSSVFLSSEFLPYRPASPARIIFLHVPPPVITEGLLHRCEAILVQYKRLHWPNHCSDVLDVNAQLPPGEGWSFRRISRPNQAHRYCWWLPVIINHRRIHPYPRRIYCMSLWQIQKNSPYLLFPGIDGIVC